MALNPQMASHVPTQFQGSMPHQPQNSGQQRQVPVGQHPFHSQQQTKAGQGQSQQQNSYTDYNPQLALFAIEKPKGAKSWEDAVPEKQQLALQDIQHELAKFRRKHNNVAQSLREITSSNCRRIINELVTSETEGLWNYNRGLRFSIASVNVEWERVNRSARQMKRVDVILETEPSGFQEPTHLKEIPGNYFTPNPTAAKGGKPANPMQSQPGQVNNMGQPQPQHKVNPPQSMGHGPPQPQGHGHGQGIPPPPPGHAAHMGGPVPGAPPPPPPGHAAHAGGPIPGAPPPPPPGPGHAMHGPGMQAGHQPRAPMPGAFPQPMQKPMPSMGKGHGVPFGVMDPNLLKKQKKHKHQQDSDSSLSSDSSSSSESDRESESDSSGSGPVRLTKVERGDYRLVDSRESSRGRHPKKSKKLNKHRSGSKVRSRSRSHSQHRANRKAYMEPPTRKRRDSDMIDPPTTGRHSGYSSVSNSPHLAHSKLHGQPPEVHIHVNTNNSSDEKEHDQERARHRRPSMHSPSSSFYKNKRNLEKIDTAIAMSRESSWDRDSGTASFSNSSAYTAEDLVFDKPERRPSMPRTHSRTKSYPYPHTSHIYDDAEHVHHVDTTRVRHVPANDYPHNARSYLTERPLPHRRASMQATANPFATRYPPKPQRTMTYAADAYEPATAYPQERYLTEHSDREDTFDVHDMVEAMKHIKQSRRASAVPPLQRRATVDREDLYTRDEDWDLRYAGNGVRYGRYA